MKSCPQSLDLMNEESTHIATKVLATAAVNCKVDALTVNRAPDGLNGKIFCVFQASIVIVRVVDTD